MAGKKITAGGGGKVTSLADARAGKAGDRKDDGIPKNNLEAVREAEAAQLLSFLAKARPLISAVDAAKAVVKDKQAAVDELLNLAAAAGFKKGEMRSLLKDTAVTGARKDLREAEERRVRFRRYCGLPVGETDELVPEAAKDEFDWRGHGYTAGLRADKPDPKAAQVPDRFHQAWLEEWHKGQEANAGKIKSSKPAPEPETETAPVVDKNAARPAPVDDFQESTAEELAAQTPRPKADGDDDGAEAV